MSVTAMLQQFGLGWGGKWQSRGKIAARSSLYQILTEAVYETPTPVRHYRRIGSDGIVALGDTGYDSPDGHQQRNPGDHHFRRQQTECNSQVQRIRLLCENSDVRPYSSHLSGRLGPDMHLPYFAGREDYHRSRLRELCWKRINRFLSVLSRRLDPLTKRATICLRGMPTRVACPEVPAVRAIPLHC
jgi:hypothetical protein